jgi:VanZ family protein
MTTTQGTLHRILVFVYGAGIAALSLLPSDDAIALNIWDKAQHFAAYAVFMIIAFPIGKSRTTHLRTALGIICFSIFIEYAQQFSPGRDTSIEDAIANSLGVISGYLFSWWLAKIYRGRGNKTATSN